MVELREKGIDAVKRAQEEEAKENYPTALRLFETAIEYLIQSQKYEKNETVRRTMKTKIAQYLDHAEQLKTIVSADAPQEATPATDGPAPAKGSRGNDQEQQLRSQIMEAALVEKPNVQWEQVAGLEAVKDALKDAVVYPLKMSHLFEKRLEPFTGILLFGPPGTGKTMLAKAVATEAHTNIFLQVSVSKIMSKFVGESERLVAMLFRVARENAPAIIFMDEVDALASQRSDSDHEVSRKVKNCLLEEIDGVGSASNKGVLVLAATNMPWMLDDAFLRRFQKKIYIPLPDEQSRAAIVQVALSKVPHSLATTDFLTIAAATQNYTGSDIAVLVKTARGRAFSALKHATHFRLVRRPGSSDTVPPSLDDEAHTMLEPCSPGAADALELSFKEIEKREWLKRISLPDVSMADFRFALHKVKPSPLNRPLSVYEEFTERFGERGDL